LEVPRGAKNLTDATPDQTKATPHVLAFGGALVENYREGRIDVHLEIHVWWSDGEGTQLGVTLQALQPAHDRTGRVFHLVAGRARERERVCVKLQADQEPVMSDDRIVEAS
jgi:hypothetical protein